MPENSNQQSTMPTNLCVNGCGFYGSTQFDGMCSVCFKENATKRQIQEEQQMQAAGVASPQQTPTSHNSMSDNNADDSPLQAGGGTTVPVPVAVQSDCESVGSTDKSDASSFESGQKRRNRCLVCKKRIGLTGFNCRCGGQFCSVHRYSDKHNCQFDYQTHGQDQIRRANPQVVSNKVDKL